MKNIPTIQLSVPEGEFCDECQFLYNQDNVPRCSLFGFRILDFKEIMFGEYVEVKKFEMCPRKQ